MGWFSSKKEDLVDEVAKSNIKKGVFIEFLEDNNLLLKTSAGWDKIKEGVEDSDITENQLKKFIISQRKNSRKKSAEKKVERETALKEDKTRKGSLFEKKVASWLKKKYGGTTKNNVLMKGNTVDRPYEIDIFFKKKGFLGSYDAWVECKNRGSSIKRTDIDKIVASVNDVNATKFVGFTYMLFVSTSPFDTDALKAAKKKGVACIHYVDGKFKVLNEPGW